MRVTVWIALSALLVGCAAPSNDESSDVPVPQSLARGWHGTVVGADSCQGGELYLWLEPNDDGPWTGTAYYESVPVGGERYRSTNRLDASWTDGQVRIAEREPDEVDALPKGLTWCFGAYDLDLSDDLDAPVLSGDYVSARCSCTVAVELEPLERQDSNEAHDQAE